MKYSGANSFPILTSSPHLFPLTLPVRWSPPRSVPRGGDRRPPSAHFVVVEGLNVKISCGFSGSGRAICDPELKSTFSLLVFLSFFESFLTSCVSFFYYLIRFSLPLYDLFCIWRGGMSHDCWLESDCSINIETIWLPCWNLSLFYYPEISFPLLCIKNPVQLWKSQPGNVLCYWWMMFKCTKSVTCGLRKKSVKLIAYRRKIWKCIIYIY